MKSKNPQTLFFFNPASYSYRIQKIIGVIIFVLSACQVNAQKRFSDKFDSGSGAWVTNGAESVRIIETNDPSHGKAMSLTPNGDVYTLIKNSDKWGSVRIEGEFYFPGAGDAYLGIVYNYMQDKNRKDFGCIYIKDGSYVQVNPRRDGNASRLLYDEFTTYLRGKDSLPLKTWHKFKAEIYENICHLYVNDMVTPKIVFPYYEGKKGMVGFEPRVTGTPVWIDNVEVTSISKLSYQGKPIPDIAYQADSLITKWEVIGPLPKLSNSIERTSVLPGSYLIEGKKYQWKPFLTDGRGAVITGSVTQYSGDKTVAYFHTTIHSQNEQVKTLHFSSVDEIALFVNGIFYGFVYRQGYVSGPGRPWNAWFDFWKNPEHAGRKVPVVLRPGNNEIIIRVRNGDFASGGFFMK